MINLDTIWHDTYLNSSLRLPWGEVEVLTVIHGNKVEKVPQLLARLIISHRNRGIELAANVDLDADQMEELAGLLLSAAKYQRVLAKQISDDADERLSEAA